MIPARLLAVLLACSATLCAADAPPAPPAATAAPARIGKVDLGVIEPELRDLLLAKAENGPLKQQLEAQEKAEEERNRAVQQAQAEGKDVGELFKDRPEIDGKQRQRFERLLRTELLRLVTKRYGNRFALIIDANQVNDEAIVYLDGEVVDLTQAIKQALQLNEF